MECILPSRKRCVEEKEHCDSLQFINSNNGLGQSRVVEQEWLVPRLCLVEIAE